MSRVMQSKGKPLLLNFRAVRDLSATLLAPMRTQFHHRDPESYPKMEPRPDIKKLDMPDKSKVFDACWQTMRRTEFKCRSDVEFTMPAFISERKACLSDPCATEVQAWDLTHYKPSDMGKRPYSRTWNECVVKCRKRKASCVHIPPNPARRKRKPIKTSHCEKNECVLGKQDIDLSEPCTLMKPSKCPRFKMPNCCKEAQDPPKCRRPFRGGLCQRRKTKYPSFSECYHEPIPEVLPVECTCLRLPAICEMWRYYHRKM